MALIESWLKGSLEFDRRVWGRLRRVLREEASGKCAYCEVATASASWGAVEHFRPRSLYWWLAYESSNLLFACEICNSGFKRDHFPVRARRARGPQVPRPGLRASAREVMVSMGGRHSSPGLLRREGPLLLNHYEV
ncbi:MAG: hypothetical protein ACK4N5_05960, partial [Myxococcales bacterium]